jgi:hypothetical protein
MKKLLFGLCTALSSLALVACGGDDDAGNGNGGGGGTTPTSSVGSDATPTAEDLERLSTIDVPGFTRSDSRVIASAANALRISTEKTAGGAQHPRDRPHRGLRSVHLRHPRPEGLRGRPSAAPSQVRAFDGLIESPGLVWDFGPIKLAPGKTGLHTYTAGYLETKDASGTSRVSANAYRAWYHDGNLHIFIEVFDRGGDSPQPLDDVKAVMSMAEAGKAAKHVFAAFTPEFGKQRVSATRRTPTRPAWRRVPGTVLPGAVAFAPASCHPAMGDRPHR